jgi:integrase/recombinase XerD
MKVNITARVKLPDKGWSFCKIVYGGNNRIRPDWVIVDGKEEHHPEPKRYYLDFLVEGRRKRMAAGGTPAKAIEAAEKQNRILAARKAATVAGIDLPQDETESNIPSGKRGLKQAVTDYLLEIQSHKKKKTHSAYSTALNYFLESCKKTTLEQITRNDLLAFKVYLRDKKDQTDRSQWNKFASVMSFLKSNGIRGLVGKNDWPVYTEEEVEIYSQDELDKFFAACTETENLWFKFFYGTAMREQEVMHCEWSWIDFEQKTATVRESKRFGWKPKAYKGRLILLSPSLMSLLKTWKEKSDSTCGLVFPTTGCKPKRNFLDEVKAIAERAGLNKKDFYLHKFRATRATRLLQGGMDIRSVMRVLGHSDMESALRYQGAQQNDVLQKQVSQLDAMGSKPMDTQTTQKRGRGRPAGSKDTKPRQYHSRVAITEVEGLTTVEEKIRALKAPAKLSTYAAISGLSESVLRRKISQGKIRAFVRSRMIMVEPRFFLEYWNGGQNGTGVKHVVDEGMKEYLRTGK